MSTKPTSSLETCSVSCSETGKSQKADVLKKSDKSIRVALQGTNIVMNLNRTDLKRPYVGNLHGLEFTTFG